MVYKTVRALKVSDNDQEIPQTQTTDRPNAPLGRTTDYLQQLDIQKTVKTKQQALSLPRHDDCKTRKDTNNAYQNKDQYRTQQAMGGT